MLIAFHLGRVYTLSLAELLTVLEQKGVSYTIKELYTEVLVIDTSQRLDLDSLQRRLGGVVKIMEVVDVLPRRQNDYLSFAVKDYFHANILKSHFLKQSGSKVQFGVSIYSLGQKLKLFGQNKRIGMELKKTLQSEGVSCRLVLPEGAALALPSVAVTNNLLLQKGAEIDLVVSEKNIYIAKTATVQDFADYGRRDYQRPSRDAQIGMIPPKVAQIMINLTRISAEQKNFDNFLLDPFCGSGTILQEAMIMGHQVLGSDISEKAVESTEKNLGWIRTRYKLPPSRFEVLVSDVKNLAKLIEGKKIGCIVTEGTLGPAYDAAPTEREINKNFQNLSKIYINAFTNFKKILSPGSRVVAALPAYQRAHGYISFPAVDKILKLGYDIEAPIDAGLLKKYPFLKVSPRNSIIYDRKEQIVVREIIIFKLIQN